MSDKEVENELDKFLLKIKESLLIINEYKQRRANSINELLEDYLCVAKEAELNLKRISPNTAPVNVGIRYDILEKGYTLPKSIQDLIEKRTNQQS